MSDDRPTFGKLLRAARFHAGFRSLKAFSTHLCNLGLSYTNDAIGHWENDRRVPPRDVLLRVLEALANLGSIADLGQVSQMLWLLGLRDLDDEERLRHFPVLESNRLLINLPERPYDQLIGRQNVVSRLLSRLGDLRDKSIVVLSGLGGIGKTAIAYEVVQRIILRGAFDALAWESARSEEFIGASIRMKRVQSLDLPSILASVARQLGHPEWIALPPEELRNRLHCISPDRFNPLAGDSPNTALVWLLLYLA